jgi:hypothetical protein
MGKGVAMLRLKNGLLAFQSFKEVFDFYLLTFALCKRMLTDSELMSADEHLSGAATLSSWCSFPS